MARLQNNDVEMGRIAGKNDPPQFENAFERRPSGYPQLSALIASHDDFHVCRRFTDLRSRLLLFKQDQISLLEARLRKLDRDEQDTFCLGSYRAGNSEARRILFAEIEKALAEYDELVARNHQMLSFESPRPKAVSSLQNWIKGTGSIARRESEYLNHSSDLLGAVVTDDTVIAWLEQLTERIFIFFRLCVGQAPKQLVSSDPRVHIFPKTWVKRTTRALMTPFIVTLILAPVIICNRVDSLTARFLTIVIAATVFVAVLSGSTKAKTVELVVAGATYTTVLIVFISSNINAEI